ncbi:MAG: hypothetical protein HYT08_03540 [Candidatus Levybacteria bacterium]|nr:hypothetical protein [Candidatus Levybacteria bacterium]
MDSKIQSGSQQPSGGADVSGVEVGSGAVSPVSVAPKKEGAPVEIRPSEPELNIHPEIAEIGVEKAEKHPVLTAEHEEAGLRLSEPRPIISDKPQTQSLPDLPLSIGQAKHIAKVGKTDDKKSWLANLVLRAFEKIRKKELEHAAA